MAPAPGAVFVGHGQQTCNPRPLKRTFQLAMAQDPDPDPEAQPQPQPQPQEFGAAKRRRGRPTKGDSSVPKDRIRMLIYKHLPFMNGLAREDGLLESSANLSDEQRCMLVAAYQGFIKSAFTQDLAKSTAKHWADLYLHDAGFAKWGEALPLPPVIVTANKAIGALRLSIREMKPSEAASNRIQLLQQFDCHPQADQRAQAKRQAWKIKGGVSYATPTHIVIRKVEPSSDEIEVRRALRPLSIANGTCTWAVETPCPVTPGDKYELVFAVKDSESACSSSQKGAEGRPQASRHSLQLICSPYSLKISIGGTAEAPVVHPAF
eukprot:tig00000605_g2506.t1